MDALLPIIMRLMGDPQTLGLLMKLFSGMGHASPQQPVTPTWEGPFNLHWLQTSLNKVLKENTTFSNQYDDTLKAAVMRYQRMKGEAVLGAPDGWAGFKTMTTLYNDVQAIK
jgi:hypothetical protein